LPATVIPLTFHRSAADRTKEEDNYVKSIEEELHFLVFVFINRDIRIADAIKIKTMLVVMIKVNFRKHLM